VHDLQRKAHAGLALERRPQDLVTLDDTQEGLPQAVGVERPRELEQAKAAAGRLILCQPQSLLLG
jgi:hypothetical protein